MKRKDKDDRDEIYNSDEFDPSINRRGNKKRKNRNSRVRKTPIVLTIVFSVLIAALVYGVWVIKFHKADQSTQLMGSGATVTETDEFGNVIEKVVEVDENSYNFLLVARDQASGNTDVMMIANYNINKQSVAIMQLPRDTYVNLGGSTRKLNSAYSYFYGQLDSGEKDRDIKALKKFADFLTENLYVEIHYSAYMDINGFGDIVDAVGGVEMYVPERMKYIDKKQGLYIDLYEGYQTLNGDKAEQFVRYRSGYATADIGRQDAQKIFMTAFIKKVTKSLTDLDKVTSLATTVAGCVRTDLTVNDLVFFGKYFVGLGGKHKVDLNDVVMITMPGKAFSYGGSYYCMNKESVVNIVNDYFNIYNFSVKPYFDKKSIFVPADSSSAVDIYNKPASDFKVNIHSGDKIDKDGIAIY